MVRYDLNGNVKENILDIPANKYWSSQKILRVASESLLQLVGHHTLLRVKSLNESDPVAAEL